MLGASSGPRAATAQIAPTTRSTGMTSIVPFGNPRELSQQAARVGDDHRLGHAEPADPAGSGLDQRGLDDRGAHDAHWHVALHLHQRAFAKRLRVGVRVGPSERRCARSAGRDELVGDPALAQRFGLGRQRGGTGRAELPSGLGPKARESGRIATLGVGVGSRRRAAATSPRQSTPRSNGPSLTSCSGASPRRLPAT